MEDIERFIKIVQQKRLLNQRELKRLDAPSDEHEELMKKLRDLKREREVCKENIVKHLGIITGHKHSIHKFVQSSKDISGLPVPHNYAQDMRIMFTDAIEFMNNIGDTYKAFTNVKENNMDILQLTHNVGTCVQTVGNELYQIKHNIAQLETLKENIAVLQQCIINTSDSIDDESLTLTISGESTDSGTTIK
ncbi:membrane protein [Lasius niger]|uniref:Membrane protein n=1 Tax=Lasius niger TaxID=67767 RepID=A0A0J7L4S7_LASNI|nr:membrane protein [Lasius niger]